jgi:hypothetical protein
LNGMVGVFADEIDAKGNAMTEVWELRWDPKFFVILVCFSAITLWLSTIWYDS